MKGIKLKHGVTFIEWDGVTVRIDATGDCDLSPILLPSLEWELRTEPPSTWDYLTQSDLDSLDENIRQQIIKIAQKFHETIGST